MTKAAETLDTEKVSYKVKMSILNPEDKLAIFENTHEPIIDQKTWERVQEPRIEAPNTWDISFGGTQFISPKRRGEYTMCRARSAKLAMCFSPFKLRGFVVP